MLEKGYPGGLLADDMGLGKTLQILYFIEWHSQLKNDNNKPYLIVAPVSLLENWENEYKKFFPKSTLSITKIYGSSNFLKEKNNLEIIKNEIKKLRKKQIILTNYETLRTYQLSFGMVDFAIVTLDEAQKIKTPGTYITNAAKALKSDFKIAMTGTPVENTLVDIWCIMDFAVSGLLGNAKEFAKEFQSPLSKENTDVELLTDKLRNKIGDFFKRRLKVDVAKDLPKKYDNENSILKKEMPKVQLDRYIMEMNIPARAGTDVLKYIFAIKDISEHPYILDKTIERFSSKELVETSAKLSCTVDILRDIQERDEKVIIFAERKETQRMLKRVCSDYFHITPSIINGDTPSTGSDRGRQSTIDYFHSIKGFNVIIMSPIAAGVGLNVTGANHIIHYSRHWNPAKEEQATDRAFRIGQEKDVYVYYPMAVFPKEMNLKSFDEILNELLVRKKILASNALFPTEQTEVTQTELSKLLSDIKENNTVYETLSLEEVNTLKPSLFEAYIAKLYELQGFEVFLTPFSNDKGADVVVLGENKNYIIQVKQSSTDVSNKAVQEIFTAKKYYENEYKCDFEPTVITNSFYDNSAQELANSNDVKLLNKNDLEELHKNFPTNMRDIIVQESRRLPRI